MNLELVEPGIEKEKYGVVRREGSGGTGLPFSWWGQLLSVTRLPSLINAKGRCQSVEQTVCRVLQPGRRPWRCSVSCRSLLLLDGEELRNSSPWDSSGISSLGKKKNTGFLVSHKIINH